MTAVDVREHVRRLLDDTGVGYAVIARAAGISAKTVRHVLMGRTRVARRTAERLCSLSVVEVRAARRVIPVEEIRPVVLQLARAGWSDTRIAQETGCAQKVIQDVRTGRLTQVLDVTARRILYAARGLMPTQWRQLAQCRRERLPTALFYDPEHRDEAIRVCQRCVVRAECAAAADGGEYGVWGGSWRTPHVSRAAV